MQCWHADVYSFLPNQPPKTQNFAQTQNTTICNDPFNPNSKKTHPIPKKKKNKKTTKHKHKHKVKRPEIKTHSKITSMVDPCGIKKKKIINYLLIWSPNKFKTTSLLPWLHSIGHPMIIQLNGSKDTKTLFKIRV